MLFKLLLIVFVLLLIFGAGRIAQLGRGVGDGIRHFKKGLEDDDGNAEGGARSSKTMAKGPKEDG
jgi:sec-independent protein translocase protein TatA